jgi:membrane protein
MTRDRTRAAWKLFRATIRLWSSRNAFQLAAALAFYTLISLAPLLLIAITLTGVFFGEEAARGEVSAQVAQFIGSDAAQFVEEAVLSSRIEEAGILPTLLGIGALLFGATTVFAQMQTALNAMWDVRTHPERSGIVSFVLTRVLSFGMVLGIGFLLLMSFLSTIALNALMRFADESLPLSESLAAGMDVSISLVLAILLFGMIFKVLPDVRLSWGHVARGAVLTGVLFVLGQILISLYLTQTGPSSAYGAAGSLVLVLMWVYYSALILFFGAAFTREYVRRGGETIQPSSGAVKVRTEIVEG